MKALNPKEQVYENFVEKYELNGLYIGKTGYRPGLLTCFLLATLPEADLESFFAEEEGEGGEPRNVVSLDKEEFYEKFPDVDAFMKEMIHMDIQGWELSVRISGVSVMVTGQAWKAVIGMIHSVSTPVHILPLLAKVEDASFSVHNYDEKLVDNVKRMFQMTQKSAIRTLDKLKKHKDIFEEFAQGCQNDSFLFPGDGIQVQGYSAGMLHDRFPLSPAGAYNYLVYLRESPEEALKDLQKGLPRK